MVAQESTVDCFNSCHRDSRAVASRITRITCVARGAVRVDGGKEVLFSKCTSANNQLLVGGIWLLVIKCVFWALEKLF